MNPKEDAPMAAAVLGASGFAGGELLRVLQAHPRIKVIAAGAAARAGEPVASVFPSLRAYGHMSFVMLEEALNSQADIVFASLPHTISMGLLSETSASKVIDLGGDFRLKDPVAYEQWYGTPHAGAERLSEWSYGLTEFNRSFIRKSNRVANPGCYPAAAILTLGPLLEAGLIEPQPLHIDAKSGVSGAGRASGEGFDYVSANENTRAYAPTGHKHIPEIEQELTELAGTAVTVSFVPHLVPMTRGIEVTAVAVSVEGANESQLQEALTGRYSNEAFVRVLGPGDLPETKRLAGTNYAEVAVRKDERTGKVLAFAALDNLCKGAAGQAVQNANLMLGLQESTGLLMTAALP